MENVERSAQMKAVIGTERRGRRRGKRRGKK
jgi:hypothetical protein